MMCATNLFVVSVVFEVGCRVSVLRIHQQSHHLDISHQTLYVPALGSMLDEGTEPKRRYFHDARMWDHSMSMY